MSSSAAFDSVGASPRRFSEPTMWQEATYVTPSQTLDSPHFSPVSPNFSPESPYRCNVQSSPSYCPNSPVWNYTDGPYFMPESPSYCPDSTPWQPTSPTALVYLPSASMSFGNDPPSLIYNPNSHTTPRSPSLYSYPLSPRYYQVPSSSTAPSLTRSELETLPSSPPQRDINAHIDNSRDETDTVSKRYGQSLAVLAAPRAQEYHLSLILNSPARPTHFGVNGQKAGTPFGSSSHYWNTAGLNDLLPEGGFGWNDEDVPDDGFSLGEPLEEEVAWESELRARAKRGEKVVMTQQDMAEKDRIERAKREKNDQAIEDAYSPASPVWSPDSPAVDLYQLFVTEQAAPVQTEQTGTFSHFSEGEWQKERRILDGEDELQIIPKQIFEAEVRRNRLKRARKMMDQAEGEVFVARKRVARAKAEGLPVPNWRKPSG